MKIPKPGDIVIYLGDYEDIFCEAIVGRKYRVKNSKSTLVAEQRDRVEGALHAPNLSQVPLDEEYRVHELEELDGSQVDSGYCHLECLKPYNGINIEEIYKELQ